MKHILQAVIIFYNLFLLPFWLGIFWEKYVEKAKMSLAKIYVCGWLCNFGIFWLAAVPCVHLRTSFRVLVCLWSGVSIALGVLSILLIRREAMESIRQNFRHFFKSKPASKGMLLLVAATAAFSILFAVPSVEDATPEILMVTRATDTMYLHEAYDDTLYERAPELVVNSPIEMLYAVTDQQIHMEPAKFVHTVLPVPFLIFFFCIHDMLADWLFGRDTANRNRYLLYILLIYTVVFYSGRTGAFGVFTNIWMPSTMLFNCILPLAAYECLKLADCVVNKRVKKKLTADIGMVVLLVLTAELILYYGAFLVLLWLGCSFVIIGSRRFLKNEGYIK